TRMYASPEYKNLLEDIELQKEKEGEISVTLNEAKLKKERDENEARNKKRNDARRIAAGLPVKVEDVEEKAKIDKKLNVDFIADESLKVMADMISLSKN